MGAVLLASTVHSFAADAVATTPPPEMSVTVAKVKNACFSDTLVVMGNLVPRNEVLVRPDRYVFGAGAPRALLDAWAASLNPGVSALLANAGALG